MRDVKLLNPETFKLTITQPTLVTNRSEELAIVFPYSFLITYSLVYPEALLKLLGWVATSALIERLQETCKEPLLQEPWSNY